MEDNEYTKYVFNNFEPIYVEISFAIVVILVLVVSIGAAYFLVILQRYLLVQMSQLYSYLQEKLQFLYVGPEPSNKEIKKENSDSSSLSSGYKMYIQRDRDHIIYYVTDESVSLTDSLDHLGLMSTRIKRRKLLRDIAPGRKRRKLLRGDFKKGKTHQMSNVRRSPTKILNISYRQSKIRREAEERRFKLLDTSSSSSLGLIGRYLRRNHKWFDKGTNTEPIETPALVPQEDSLSRIIPNSDKSDLIILEEEESMSYESEELKENFTPSTFVKYYGRSQFYRKPKKPFDPSKAPVIPWKLMTPFSTDDSSSDSTYSDSNSDSIVLVSNDPSSNDSENILTKILEKKYWTD